VPCQFSVTRITGAQRCDNLTTVWQCVFTASQASLMDHRVGWAHLEYPVNNSPHCALTHPEWTASPASPNPGGCPPACPLPPLPHTPTPTCSFLCQRFCQELLLACSFSLLGCQPSPNFGERPARPSPSCSPLANPPPLHPLPTCVFLC
jgi:hypothetical protein